MWVTRFALSPVRNKRFTLGLLSLCIASPVLAVSKAELETRIQQLEQKLNRILLDQNDQENSLHREMQKLRGDMEVQAHEIRKLDKKQRDLYLDIDQRLNALQSGKGTSAGYAGAATGSDWDQGNASTDGVPAANTGVDEDAVRKDYDSALATLKKGQYDQALAEFRQFLKQHPNSRYADNAQYWIGEVHYVNRRFTDALKEFESVIKRYPDSLKVADARLKIGFINYELKQWDAARSALSRVTRDYPDSTPARLARERLQRMSKEGH